MKKPGLEKAVLDRAKTLKNPITLDYSTFRKAVLTMRAINHNERLQILSMLKQKKEMTVTEIYSSINSDQSVVSQHLAMLRRAGIVNGRRNKKFIHYSINKERLAEINRLIDALN